MCIKNTLLRYCLHGAWFRFMKKTWNGYIETLESRYNCCHPVPCEWRGEGNIACFIIIKRSSFICDVKKQSENILYSFELLILILKYFLSIRMLLKYCYSIACVTTTFKYRILNTADIIFYAARMSRRYARRIYETWTANHFKVYEVGDGITMD